MLPRDRVERERPQPAARRGAQRAEALGAERRGALDAGERREVAQGGEAPRLAAGTLAGEGEGEAELGQFRGGARQVAGAGVWRLVVGFRGGCLGGLGGSKYR